MKFKMKVQSLMAAVLMAALLFVPLTVTTGCKTTPVKAAVNVSDSARITVEHALAAWNDYIPRFHPTLAEQARVRAAWEKYRATQLVVLDAAILFKQTGDAAAGTKLNVAIAEAGRSMSDLISLIRTLGVKL